MRLVAIGAAALFLSSCSDGETGPDSPVGAVVDAAPAEELSPKDLPRIRPGEWEVATTQESGEVEVTRQCIGPDEAMSLPGDSGSCPAKIRKSGGQYTIEGLCPADGYVSRIRMTMQGDFQQRYIGQIDIVVLADGREVTRYHERTEARRLGPCTP